MRLPDLRAGKSNRSQALKTTSNFNAPTSLSIMFVKLGLDIVSRSIDESRTYGKTDRES